MDGKESGPATDRHRGVSSRLGFRECAGDSPRIFRKGARLGGAGRGEKMKRRDETRRTALERQKQPPRRATATPGALGAGAHLAEREPASGH